MVFFLLNLIVIKHQLYLMEKTVIPCTNDNGCIALVSPSRGIRHLLSYLSIFFPLSDTHNISGKSHLSIEWISRSVSLSMDPIRLCKVDYWLHYLGIKWGLDELL